jgi:hypothetical protein
MYLVKGVHIDLHTQLSLSVLLQLLHLRLPIELGIKAQHLPGLLDTNQTLPRILGLGGIIDIREDLLDEFRGRGGECDIGVCDIEYVSSLEVTFCCQSECLSTVSSVDITESANLSAWNQDGELPRLLTRVDQMGLLVYHAWGIGQVERSMHTLISGTW